MRRTSLHLIRIFAAGIPLLLGLVGAAAWADIYAPGEVSVILKPGHTIDEVNSRWGTTTMDTFPEGGMYLLYASGAYDMEQYAAQMQTEDPAIAEAEANYYQDTAEGVRQMIIVAVGGTLVDYEDQAISTRIGVDAAHLATRGEGVRIAILDSGVDPNHVAYAGHLAGDGYDFVGNDPYPWEEANGVDDDGDGIIDNGYGHGTMVAGIVSLVAPAATLLPVRILNDEGRADAFTVAKGIRYAVDHHAQILNMSFGVPRTISMIGHQLDFADSMGVTMVAGAGNENRENPVYFPGSSSKVMLITALDSLDVKASFADYNSKVHVSAPGTGVRSAYPDGWALGAGCSFATPFVTGEAALILSLAPTMPSRDVADRIALAVDPIDQIPGNYPYQGKLGSGRLYLPDAVAGLAGIDGGPVADFPRRAHAFPNPSRGKIRFSVPESDGAFTVLLHTATGRMVRRLESSGGGTVVWDGRDGNGHPLSSGIYYAVVRSREGVSRLPISLIR